MIPQSNKEKETMYYDRVAKLERLKSDGSYVLKGGSEGGVKLRIKKRSEIFYIEGHLSSLNVLNAPILFPPSEVGDDGQTISISFHDTSSRNFVRKFIITFFDEDSAYSFFEKYCTALPTKYEGPNFHNMRDNINEEEGTGDEDNAEEDDDDDSAKEDDNDDDNAKEDDDDNAEEDEEDDSSTGLPSDLSALEFDCYGASQDVYQPFYPREKN